MPAPASRTASSAPVTPLDDLPRPSWSARFRFACQRRQVLLLVVLFGLSILLSGSVLALALAEEARPVGRWLVASLIALLPAHLLLFPVLWRDGPAKRDLLAAALHAATPAERPHLFLALNNALCRAYRTDALSRREVAELFAEVRANYGTRAQRAVMDVAALRHRQAALLRHFFDPVFGTTAAGADTAANADSTPVDTRSTTAGRTPIPIEYAVTKPIKPARLAQLLQLSVTRLADILKVERTLLVTEPMNEAVQAVLVPLATTVGKQLWALDGDRQALARWFHYQPLVLCEERTPLELVAADEVAMLDWEVERVLNGVYA